MEECIKIESNKDGDVTVQNLIDALMKVEDKSRVAYGYVSSGDEVCIDLDSLTLDSLDLSLSGKIDINQIL